MATSSSSDASATPSSDDFEAAVRALGGVVRDTRCHVDRDGRRFTMKWTSRRKNTPPRVTITTPAGPLAQPQASHAATSTKAAAEMGPFRGAPSPRIPSPAPLTLRLETRVDRAGKFLRINRETQTGDASFDERIYLESDAADPVVLAALVDPGLRTNVVKCLELGSTVVTLDLEGNLCVERPLPETKLLQAAQLTPLLDALSAAAEAIPPLVAARPVRTFGAKVTTACFVGAILTVPVYFLCNWPWEALRSDLYTSSVLAGLTLWIVSLPILAVVLRGRSVSLRDLVTCAGALLLGLPLGATDLMLTVNGLFDTSAPIAHETRVTHLRFTSGKNTSYYVTFGSWHPGEATIELNIGSSLYYTLAEGTTLSVTTSQGALGWERLRGITGVSGLRTWN
jgi:hypothetical protein